MLRVIMHGEKAQGKRAPTFDAYLDEQFICRSSQVIYDAARALLEMGYDPEEILTARHVNSENDSFVPKPIGEWAKWTVVEKNKGGLELREWAPHPDASEFSPEPTTERRNDVLGLRGTPRTSEPL